MHHVRLALYGGVLVALLLMTVPGIAAPADADGWRNSTPEEQGVSSARLLAMFRDIEAKGGAGLHSVVVVKNGALIAEAYLPPYHAETLHNIKSASKSILSALVGIALERKIIESLDQKVSDFYPDFAAGPGKQDINLRHLLTMSAGFDWRDYRESGGEPVPYDLDAWKLIPMRSKPGAEFQYNTMLAHMMSAILTKTTGGRTSEFARNALFGPLGITRFSWSKDKRGIDIGGSEVFLTPRDMAKFGQLFLQGGKWSGRQVVSARWVSESTAPHTHMPYHPCTEHAMDYGYWWWLPERGYMAKGSLGQYIMVRPDLNMVVAVTGEDECAIYPYLDRYLFVASTPRLPPDPSAQQELRRVLQRLENPAPRPAPTLPAVAGSISARQYSMAPNAMGMRFFTLTFLNKDEARVDVVFEKMAFTFPVGLDGIPRTANVGISLGNNSEPSIVAARGGWTGNNSFEFHFHIVGDVISQTFALVFSGEELSMQIRSGAPPINLTGKR